MEYVFFFGHFVKMNQSTTTPKCTHTHISVGTHTHLCVHPWVFKNGCGCIMNVGKIIHNPVGWAVNRRTQKVDMSFRCRWRMKPVSMVD